LYYSFIQMNETKVYYDDIEDPDFEMFSKKKWYPLQYPATREQIEENAHKWAILFHEMPDDVTLLKNQMDHSLSTHLWSVDDRINHVFAMKARIAVLEEEARIREEKVNKYQYLVTFTVDPKKHPEITPELEERITRLLESVPNRKALSVEECSYVKELHKSGRPHWHMKLVLLKALRSDAFVTFTKAYGNIDISRSKHTNGQHIDLYLEKEGEVKVLKSNIA